MISHLTNGASFNKHRRGTMRSNSSDYWSVARRVGFCRLLLHKGLSGKINIRLARKQTKLMYGGKVRITGRITRDIHALGYVNL